MKSNKGYTLVELLVAVALLLVVMAEVGALMINSQNLYSHGFYEVNLQEESQLVIQQIEDLLMGAAIDVQYETKTYNGIDSDVLTIVTAEPRLSATGVPTGDYDEVTYKIGLAFDVQRSDGTLPGGGVVRPSDDFGTEYHKFDSLVMSRQVGTGDATYSTMAEGVRSLRVYVFQEKSSGAVTDEYLQNYKDGDYVTIYLEMQNEQYSYKTDTSAHSIYLRNMPGSGGTPKPTVSPVSGGGNNDKVVNVLREHTFDLHDYVGDDYVEFKWKEINGSTAKYTLGTSTGKLSCVESLNKNWTDEVPMGNAVILAKKAGADWSDSIEIQMYTEKVTFSNMPLYIYDNMTAEATSVFPITGICPDDATKVNIVPVMVLKKLPASADAFQFDDSWGCGKEIDCKVSPAPTEWFQQVLWKGLQIDEDGNTIVNTDGNAITMSNYADSSMKTVAIPQSGILHYSTYTHTGGNTLSAGGTLGANYSLVTNNADFLNLGGGNATYHYGTLCTHDANCVVMHTTTHLPNNVPEYWQKVVEDCEGFIALRFKMEWAHMGTNTCEFYGYWYPQQSGTAAQHDKIMERIATVYGGADGTEYNFVVTTPTAYPTPPLGASGAAAGSNLESTGVSLISTTEGLITIKNTGTANSGSSSWTFTVDAGISLESISCSTTGFGMSCSGNIITITGYTDIAAGDEVDLAFTYTKAPEPLTIPDGSGGYALSGRNAWADNAQYNVSFTNPTGNKISSITVTMHVTAGTVTTIGGGCTGTVSGDTLTVTFDNYGNGIPAGGTVSTNIALSGAGDIEIN